MKYDEKNVEKLAAPFAPSYPQTKHKVKRKELGAIGRTARSRNAYPRGIKFSRKALRSNIPKQTQAHGYSEKKTLHTRKLLLEGDLFTTFVSLLHYPGGLCLVPR